MKNRKEILKKIESGEIKMKSKWWFEAIKIAKTGGWISVTGITILAIIMVKYFIEIYDPRELAVFEDIGWQILYEDFPYHWGIMTIVGLVTSTIVWSRLHRNYKKSFWENMMTTIAVVALIVVLALILDR